MEAKAVGLNWNGVKVAVCGGCPELQIGVTGNIDLIETTRRLS
jgi:hypothetical protein